MGTIYTDQSDDEVRINCSRLQEDFGIMAEAMYNLNYCGIRVPNDVVLAATCSAVRQRIMKTPQNIKTYEDTLEVLDIILTDRIIDTELPLLRREPGFEPPTPRTREDDNQGLTSIIEALEMALLVAKLARKQLRET